MQRRKGRFVPVFGACFHLSSVFAAAGPTRIADVSIAPKTGQVIAISEMLANPSTLVFEAVTGSRYGHIGIVAQSLSGPMVFHADPPAVQKTALADFLERARVERLDRPQFTLLEPADPLSWEEANSLVSVMERMEAAGVPYNYSWTINERSVNCSEFVWKTFRAIGRLGIGEIERAGQMNLGAFDGMIARVAGRRLDPQSQGVTPLSVVSSPRLRVVHAELPVGRILSDAEIFQAWEAGGGLAGFSRLTGIPPERLKSLGARASTAPYRPYPSRWRQNGRR